MIFHRSGVATVVKSSKAIPTFDDTDPNRYWSALNPPSSTMVAGWGTKISVLSTTSRGNQMTLQVSVKK